MVSYWNVAGLAGNAHVAELKRKARAAFSHEIKLLCEHKDQPRSHSIAAKPKVESAMIFGNK